MRKHVLILVLLVSFSPHSFAMDIQMDWLLKHLTLIELVQEGQIDQIDALLKDGVNLNIHEVFGAWQTVPALNNTTRKEYKSTCTLLAHDPYYLMWAEYPETLLHIASRCGKKRVATLLIAYVTVTAQGNTTLVSTFLNQPDPRGFTALHLAAKNNCLNTAKELLRHDVNLLHKSTTGHTPREIAHEMGHQAMVSLLSAAEQALKQ